MSPRSLRCLVAGADGRVTNVLATGSFLFEVSMTKLVIVDDHEALREGLAAMLGNSGQEVVGVAGNVAAGVDVVEHANPEVAIVDIRLPDGSGIDLTRELLSRRPELG